MKLLGSRQEIIVTPAELAETMRLMEQQRGRRRPADRFYGDTLHRSRESIAPNRFIEFSIVDPPPAAGAGAGIEMFRMSEQGGLIMKITVNPSDGAARTIAFSTEPNVTPISQPAGLPFEERPGLIWRTNYEGSPGNIREWEFGFKIKPNGPVYLSNYAVTWIAYISIDIFDAGAN